MIATDPAADVAAVGRIEAVQKILEVVCRSTGMGCAAVVRMTDTRWIACAVRDEIDFGLNPADEFDVVTTLCEEIRQTGRPVVIDDVAKDPVYCHHPAPTRFNYQSYISVPLRVADGQLFGTLWAVSRQPAKLNTPQTIGMFQLFADLIASHLDADRRIAAEQAARDAAAERQSRLESIIASAKDYAVISIDTNGDIDNWAGGAEAVFGWTAAETVGRPFDVIWTAEDIAGGSPRRELFVAERDGVCPDNRVHVRADGRRIFVVGACRPVYNAAGKLAGFVKVCRDETERRRGEEVLAEAVRRNDSALLAGDVGTFTWHIADDRLYGDANFSRIFGLAHDGTGAFPLADYMNALHPDDRAAVSAKVDRSVTEGVPYHAEYRIVHDDGSERTIVARGKVERDSGDRPERFSGVIVDVTDRRRIEADLHTAEGRYRQLFDSIDEGFCTVKVLFDDNGDGGRRPVDYRFLETNPAFERQTGMYGVIGKRIRELVPEHETHWFDLYGRVATSGLPARFEHDAVGLGRRFDVYAARVGDAGDDTVAIVFNDVTERQAAATALRASEAESRFLSDLGDALRPLSDPLDVQITAARLLGRHLRVNRVAYFEVAGDEYVVKRDYFDGVRSLVGRYPVAAFGPAMLASFNAGRTVVERDVAANADLAEDERAAYAGIEMQALVGVPLLRAGELVAGLTVHVARPRAWTAADIALIGQVAERTWAAVERARVEAELTFQRHQLELIFRDSPAAMALWRGEDLMFERVNPQYEALFAGRPLLGKPLLEALPELRGQGFDDLLRRVLLTGEPFVGHEALARLARTADGPVENRYFDFSYLQVRDPDGRPWGVYDHAVDVTDRVVARQALEESQGQLRDALAERQSLLDAERAARGEAEQAGRMKDDFLATLSHELRTPLNAIVGWTQILQSTPGNAPDVDEGLAVIARNARAQTQIIEDILDMSRIISGKLRLDVQRVDLAALVKAGADTVQPAADAKHVRLQMLVDPAAGSITGDPGRLHQVFWNLVSNAVKFTPRGGRVQVLLERVNSHVEVSVIDTGEGIESAFLPHVFDRFRQADAGTTRRHGGLGLGLAIVKQIVEMHGGGVRVKSPGKGQGSTFVVALPMTVLHPEPDRPDAAREHPTAEVPLDAQRSACDQLAGISVVAVDDEADGVAMIRRLLTECGAEVRTATSAAAAVALIQADPPTVLISDIGMPGEDGYALIRQVRALPVGRGNTVSALALTAYARAADRVRALEAGFQMHLAKPVEPGELIVTVAALAKLAFSGKP